jgi:formylmethanofuran dehydrogenase subunit C
MRAGTVVVGGRLGAGVGTVMRRGSILALGDAVAVGACFADCGVHDLVVLRLLARELVRLGLAELGARLGPMRRFVGDVAIGGRGELLVLG